MSKSDAHVGNFNSRFNLYSLIRFYLILLKILILLFYLYFILFFFSRYFFPIQNGSADQEASESL